MEEAKEALSETDQENGEDSLELSEPTSSSSQAYSEASEMLAKGILGFYQPPLLAVKSDLNDLIEKQETICQGLITSKQKLIETAENSEIKDMVGCCYL